MNDQFLHDLRRTPPPEFARRLRQSLNESAVPAAAPERRAHRTPGWLPLAASVAIVASAFMFPGVRAGAQAFLDLFRVTSVVGVAFETQSLRALATSGVDIPTLLGGPAEVLTAPSEPVALATADEAASMAGIDVVQPAWRPVGMELDEVLVMPEEAARFTADTGNIELVLEALGIDDLTVPESLDGQSVTVRIPPIVQLIYGQASGSEVRFFQAHSPVVTLPVDTDLPRLAEIALRIVGLDREQAFNLAWSIDWRSTLLIPVPAGEADFREVNVAGHQGLAVVPKYGNGNVLLWGDGERVFAMAGSLALEELLEMAQTAQ